MLCPLLPLERRPHLCPHLCLPVLQSWFDDRVECRNALSKLPYLTGIKDLNRDFLPWTRYAEEERDILVMEGIQEGPVGDVL